MFYYVRLRARSRFLFLGTTRSADLSSADCGRLMVRRPRDLWFGRDDSVLLDSLVSLSEQVSVEFAVKMRLVPRLCLRATFEHGLS